MKKIFKAYAHKGDVLLVDSYSINTNYLSKMKKIFKVATFDDLFLEKKEAN
jgi:spore coat polysaccharide biosynthesis predicted glycosyltransferase SpsG